MNSNNIILFGNSNDEEFVLIDNLMSLGYNVKGYDGEYIEGPEYAGSISRRCPDISKAQKDLGYNPKISWKNGVNKTIEWYRNYLSDNPKLNESFYKTK